MTSPRQTSSRWGTRIQIQCRPPQSRHDVHERGGDLERATAVLRELIARDPMMRRSLQLGVAVKQKDDFAGPRCSASRRELDTALGDAPFTLGVVLLAEGRSDQAVAAFQGNCAAISHDERITCSARCASAWKSDALLRVREASLRPGAGSASQPRPAPSRWVTARSGGRIRGGAAVERAEGKCRRRPLPSRRALV